MSSTSWASTPTARNAAKMCRATRVFSSSSSGFEPLVLIRHGMSHLVPPRLVQPRHTCTHSVTGAMLDPPAFLY